MLWVRIPSATLSFARDSFFCVRDPLEEIKPDLELERSFFCARDPLYSPILVRMGPKRDPFPMKNAARTEFKTVPPTGRKRLQKTTHQMASGSTTVAILM